MNYDQQLLNDIDYSIISPFDLSSSNEAIRYLTPESAGKMIADELIAGSNEAALVCIFNAGSYDQLSVFLSEVYVVFSIEKLAMIKSACDYMADFESNKRLSDSALASSAFKTVSIQSVNSSNGRYHDVVADYEIQQEISVDPVAELAALETFKADFSTEIQTNISLVNSNLTTVANKLMVAGSAEVMATEVISHCDGLPQNTPFTLALCFAGSVAAVNYINTMIVG